MAYPSSRLLRLQQLGTITVEQFLNEYWQKKPLLIRQAFPDFEAPVSADELAGLALEDDVVSRLVVQRDESDWQVEHGPLPEERFAQLPESHWTLLVQHADALDPAINALLDAFRFIPNWRLDDIMISYAADKGGVGPHFDYYDVFLLQAQGKRRWRIGQHCSHESPLLPTADMKILQDFDTVEDWIVEPGDLLYIPPNIAHWGEADGECMTYSIGFRAPSHAEVLLDFSEEMASFTNPDMRYTDPGLRPQQLAGEISQQSIEQVQAIIHQYSTDKAALAGWFGEYMTRPNPTADAHFQTFDEEFDRNLMEAGQARLSRFARCAFFEEQAGCLVFINGAKWHCSRKLAVMLSNYEPIHWDSLDTLDRTVVVQIADAGFLISSEDDE
ncbi:cupin domain-containing protein [Teredinibacter turnerae]|uniref:cupin domain-containing protein n=1 Tax=Teredinibacter turnerae TaxID=2426 RepID=UPI0003A74855|nr:cupin domain-containing protein [Teredinibacter turnerae]